MADQHSEAEAALLKAIKVTAENAERVNVSNAGPVLRDLAYAYRAIIGGQQPGGIVSVSSK